MVNPLDYNIAVNLKRIRKSKKLSLDRMAEATGVSKSMLGQIERGESNPTIATIGKIVEGIRISFNDLLEFPKEDVKIIKKENIPVETKDKYCTTYVYFPYEKRYGAEIYVIEIKAGGSYPITLQREYKQARIFILSGELTLVIQPKQYRIKQNEAIQIATGKECLLCNQGSDLLRLQAILSEDLLQT